VSFADIANHLNEESGTQMPIDSIRHQIAKLPGFQVVKGRAMDARRLACDQSEIDRHYEALEAVLEDFPAALVVNIDETEHQEWVDAHAEKAVFPESDGEATLGIPGERETKRATLIAAITADGRHLRPLIVINGET
jgi:predicted translin family RNA/ssDNA-binding protein